MSAITDQELSNLYQNLLDDDSFQSIANMRLPNNSEPFNTERCLEFANKGKDNFKKALSNIQQDALL